MIKRFIRYYRPHIHLFILDISAALLSSMLAIIFPVITRALLNDYLPQQQWTLIYSLFALMLGIYIVQTGLNYIRIKWGHILGVRMEADMRRDLFHHVQKLSFTYFDNTKTGHIMSRISNDLNMIAEVAHHGPEDLLISVFIITGAYAFMFSFSPVLSLISLIPLVLMILWGLKFGTRMRSRFRKVRKEIAEINSTVENSVQGIREVKAFANERLESKKFSTVNKSFQIAKEEAYTMMAKFFSGVTFLRQVYYLVVVASGAILIGDGTLTVNDLVAFILYVGIILPPIDRLINFVEQIQQGLASFERFIDILEIDPDIEDHSEAIELQAARGEVVLNEVSFAYKGTENIVLKNMSLNIAPGKKVAIVGESGAGKSTLVALIPRFYEPDSGNITIDKYDVSHLSQKSLRRNIGIVQQNVFLFDSTIRENIAYGNPKADDDAIWEAARQANIADFINELPEKLDTLVGERGVKLSGGQKQRISIARVFLKNPKILIFDEATSSLDTESEALIQDAMERLSQDRTTIIIAHRLSTVKHVDRIYVMQKGELVEAGTHTELISQKGYYFSLYNRNAL